jgi:hypothetical protein
MPIPETSKTEAPVTKNEPSVSMTPTQMKEMMVAFATELRRPTEEQQAELDKKKADLERAKRDKIELVKLDAAMKIDRENRCDIGMGPHRKQNGETTVFRGQIFSDGYYHPMCIRCQKQFPKIKAHPERDGGIDVE